jgi:hypothetical protein
MRMPYYVRKVRKKYLADDNVDFEIDLPIWDYFWFWFW